jgi:PAS domain S-box-containing protein
LGWGIEVDNLEETQNPSTTTQLTELAVIIGMIGQRVIDTREKAAIDGKPLPTVISKGLDDLFDNLTTLNKLVEQFESERRNLAALVDIGQVVNSSLDTTTVLNEVMDTIIRITGAKRAFLLMSDDQGKMEMVVARNWEKESIESEDYKLSTTIVNRVLDEGVSILTTNASADPRFDNQQSIIAYNLRSILCIPLKVKGKLTGVIYADNAVREGLFTEKERNLLSAFGNQAAVALENAMLFESVQRTLNEVTELKNLMEDVFASIASGVITADVTNEITLCNQAAGEILGYEVRELLGTSLQTLLPTISPELSAKLDEVKAEEEKFIDLEIQTNLENRGTVDLRLSLSPLKTVDKQTQGVAIVLDDLTERKRLEAQRRLFERMVSPAVIDQLDPDSLQLGGRRIETTTLFADIRGYTSFSERIDPESLFNVLNRYLGLAADAILLESGTIDKFMGDAVMAWFNAPIPQPDHVLRAVRAALAIQEHVIDLHREFQEEFRLQFGIGIHLGEALLGLVGTQKRLEYTAIGDSVNIAKRLQENALPGQILISQQAIGSLKGEVRLGSLSPMEVAGKTRPLDVFEVLGMV